MEERHPILENLAHAVVKMHEKQAEQLAQEAIQAGIDAYDVIQYGLAEGMNTVGEKYEQGEYFIPQLLLCSDAMYAGLDVVKPLLQQKDSLRTTKVVIGVIEGDTHDIGKSLVKMMLDAEGFDVIDLGRDVAIDRFIDAAEQHHADFICVSTLMSTTMSGMSELIIRLKAAGIRDKYKVVVGGGPVTLDFSRKIGADGYSPNAAKAVRLMKAQG